MGGERNKEMECAGKTGFTLGSSLERKEKKGRLMVMKLRN